MFKNLILISVLLFYVSISAQTILPHGVDSIQIEHITVYRITPTKLKVRLNFNAQAPIDVQASFYRLDIAINAGMYMEDGIHVGYMTKQNEHINKYQSFFCMSPKLDGIPLVRIVEKDMHDYNKIIKDYGIVLQNLRLIKTGGQNRWSKDNKKKWSELALGIDKQGKIIIAFSRHPYTMYEFNELLLNSNLNIDAMQHLEGGPEASIYFKDHYEMMGSYETNFNENDDNNEFWDIPNIIGFRFLENNI